jgi:hypothetical protein
MIPSATQLIDSEGDVWTVAGGVISLNGVVQTATHRVILLLYVGGVIYQENSDCLWWSWTNNTWAATSQPAAAGISACSSRYARTVSTPAVSANGSMIPTVAKLVDSRGSAWTVSNGVISINGSVQVNTHKVIVLLYFNGIVYQENSDCLWWKWINGAWVSTSQPAAAGLPGCGATASDATSSAAIGIGTIIKTPAVSGTAAVRVASASGSMIPTVSQLVDSTGNVWTVSGGVISINGATQSVTHKVIVLLYVGGVIYQENSDCLWWSWSNGTWVSATQPAASGLPSCSSSISSTASSSVRSSSSTSSSASSSNTSSTASTSASSSSSTSSNGVPAAAAAVGYNVNTFDTVSYNPTNGPWYEQNFYSSNGPANAAGVAQNADGSLSIPGNTVHNSGANISSAMQSHSGDDWVGTAFGGGAYFEAVISFDNQNNQNFPNGGPAFWALDIEHTSQGPYQVSWPGMPKDSSGNPYDDFFEVDFFEYDLPGGYQFGIGNWYGYPPTKSTSNPTSQYGHNVVGSLMVPAGTDFSQPHKYGTLWVPATGSGQNTTTQGYLQNYFDGVPLGPKYFWDYHDPNAPGYPAPAPAVGSTAMSGMDWRHMFLILGTEPEHPMTVYSVKVWQASASDNLVR